MRVLLTGATGFIGGRVLQAFLEAGHVVVAVSRHDTLPSGPTLRHLAKDFSLALDPSDWLGAVEDIDVVINAVGILRERGSQRFDLLHHRAPVALFQAAAAAGVRRIIQISALGADDFAATAYHQSKRAADDALLALPVEAIVVQPSLVFGAGGASTAMFTMQASQPAVPLPGNGGQDVQPVHVDDLVQVVLKLATDDSTAALYAGGRVAIVGPEPMTLKEFYRRLRRSMGFSTAARFVGTPMPFMRALAWLGKYVPGSPLDPDTLSMLERGSTASATDTHRILGRHPRGVEAFVPAGWRRDARLSATLRWIAPLLRVIIALVWVLAGVFVMLQHPHADSISWFVGMGVPVNLAPMAVYGGAALALAFGLLVLWPQRRRWLWRAQIVVILGVIVVLTLSLPRSWLHLFSPLVLMLPLLGLTWLMHEIEGDT